MIEQECDTIIIGGGSAGATLAARLSEDPLHRVPLLEAGQDLRTAITPEHIRIPTVTAASFPVLRSRPHSLRWSSDRMIDYSTNLNSGNGQGLHIDLRRLRVSRLLYAYPWEPPNGPERPNA